MFADHAESLNLKVKYRESFWPLAPPVLRERVSGWFELDVLVAGNCCLRKENQGQALKQNYETAFELD